MSDSRRPRIALFSPLNPVRSGISDYTEENLPYWSEFADLDLVVDGYEPTAASIRSGSRVLNPAQFLACKDQYDGTLYQVGNNYEHCGYMVPCMAHAPGVAVIHDYSLSYLILGLTAMQGDLHSLRRILDVSAADGSGKTPWDLLLSRVDPYEVSLAAPIVQMARGVIVHNHFAEARLRRSFPDKRMAVIPHPTPIRQPRADQATLRKQYGFREDDQVLASVSSVAYNKRLSILVDALSELSERQPRLKLLVVGQGSLGGALREAITSRGLTDRVVLTGWVTAEQYLDYIDIADIVADLRFPTAGETSGSILRAIQAGKPLVVSDHGFFSELDDAYAWKIRVGGEELQELVQAVQTVLNDPVRRAAMSSAAARYARQSLRREDVAARYMGFVNEALEAKDPVTPWRLPSQEGATWTRTALSSLYKFGRVGYYRRRYGFRDTVRKVMAR